MSIINSFDLNEETKQAIIGFYLGYIRLWYQSLEKIRMSRDVSAHALDSKEALNANNLDDHKANLSVCNRILASEYNQIPDPEDLERGLK